MILIDAEPFRIHVDDAVLEDLDRRLERTRLPAAASAGWRLGMDRDYLQRLIRHWRERYDWRLWEARLNRHAHYRARVDGIELHLLIEPGSGSDPPLLLLTHGWPGSVFEFHKVIDPLAHPERYGGAAEDAFTVVCPSLPGFGFSGAPPAPMTPIEIADLWARLIGDVLGRDRVFAQGGDWGSIVTSWLALRHPEQVRAIHLNMVPLKPYLGSGSAPLSEDERGWIARFKKRTANAMGYFAIQGTRPDTLAYALADSPAGQAAWIVEKFQHTPADEPGELSHFSMDELITNVMIYWVTNTALSSSWIYHAVTERGGLELGAAADGTPRRIEVPTGFFLAPYDLSPIPPRSWLERAYRVVHFAPQDRGGHFAALERPEAFAADVRAFFSAFR